ncbi:capsular polysaccharide synthesis protein [Sphingobacterium sp. WM]|uniref:capsular polysaccharide synthesis protein n=1 Tax=Sphingobacterium sp. WM TaxID=3031802 RepID=UPI00240D9999|nr:capsular polysaccharide synthesis protein [Sphingobacterium sp. WM]WFB62062.1 capsular polysaccharide synthesis protein [Sphingobacterium sp. WM]
MLEKVKKIPFVKNIWSSIRKTKIIKKHHEVSQFWRPIIDSYYSREIIPINIIPKKEFEDQKIIWQYWGQGVQDNSLPEVVKICFNSVDKHNDEFQVIRLDDTNYSEYIDFPEFVQEKVNSGLFKRTFFSDLLRLALLDTYGGVWLDATILQTGSLDSKLLELPYFMYQRDEQEVDKKFWENSYSYYWGWGDKFKVKVLNSIIYAKRGNPLIKDMLQLILFYWKTQNEIIDYFFFQILYNELVNGPLKDNKCSVISDVYPHILQTKFNGVKNLMDYPEALSHTTTHKMSYFNTEGIDNFKSFIKNQK